MYTLQWSVFVFHDCWHLIIWHHSSKRRGETRLDLNSLRYIFRGPRYWIPPDNSALNHLDAGERRIGKGPLISRWVSTGSWIMQEPAKG